MAKQKRTPVSEKRNVRRKEEIPPMNFIVVTNMEPIRLEACWSVEVQRELRQADMYGFVKFSQSLPDIDETLLKEYVRNYDVTDGTSTVNGVEIVVDQATLHEHCYLPISEVAVNNGAVVSDDFIPEEQFKTGQEALDPKQGWRAADAKTPELVEWLRFAAKRLTILRHSTYVPKKILYAVVVTLRGMQLNWAAYVSNRIHNEIGIKRRSGRMGALLCSNYVSIIVRKTLLKELHRPRKEVVTPMRVPESGVPQVISLEETEKEDEASTPERTDKGKQAAPSTSTKKKKGQTSTEDYAVKERLLVQLDQLRETLLGMEDVSALKKSLDDARSLVSIATKGRNAAIQQKEQVEAQCELLRRQIVDLQEKNDNISSLKSIGDTEQTALRQALDRERTEVDGLRKDKAAILEEQSKLRYNLRMENQALTDKVKALETQLRNPSAVLTEATTSQTEFPGAERTDKSSGRILELEEQVRQLGNINDELSQRIMELEEGSSETELEDEESPVREQKGANEPPLETEPTVVDLTNATEVVNENVQEDYGTEGETHHVCGDAAQ